MSELISRQAAIDAFDGVKVDEENCTEYDIGYNDGIDFAISKLSVLPPAQPEPCEDAVSRKDCLKALSNMMDTDGFRNGWAVSRANMEIGYMYYNGKLRLYVQEGQERSLCGQFYSTKEAEKFMEKLKKWDEAGGV